MARYEEATKASTIGAITLDWDALVDLVAPELERIYRDAARLAAKDAGYGPFGQLNEAARDYARKRAAEMVGKKWVDGELVDNPNAKYAITDATRQRLRDLTELAFDDGMSPRDLRSAILESSDFSASRAQLISQTELTNAQAQSAMDSWSQSGVVAKKIWLLSNDHGVPDECDENAAAGEIPVDEAFPSGHMAPGAHPGCFCDCAAVLE